MENIEQNILDALARIEAQVQRVEVLVELGLGGLSDRVTRLEGTA